MVLRATSCSATKPPSHRRSLLSVEFVAGVPLEPHEIIHDHFTQFRKQLGDKDPNTKLILDEL